MSNKTRGGQFIVKETKCEDIFTPEDFNEDFEEEEPESRSSNKKVINEEFLDKAYDYAQGVVKVIRNNFKTTEEKVVMLESLQKAINYYIAVN